MCPWRAQRTLAQASSAFKVANADATEILAPPGVLWKVWIAGGTNNSTRLSSAVLYDPTTGTFTVRGTLPRACGSRATLLANGMVLFSGGFDGTNAVSSAELYNRSSRAFLPTRSLNIARAGPSPAILGNGKILVAGTSITPALAPIKSRINLASADLSGLGSHGMFRTGSISPVMAFGGSIPRCAQRAPAGSREGPSPPL
jgi:Galactose oxidase, central domain